jgi:NADH:ubiquinone oxidoreductase subunit H
MIVVSSIATILFLGGGLRPFSGTHALDFLDYLPALLMLGIAGYCFYRAPKQPVAVQKGFMAVVGLLCGGLALLLAGPVAVPAMAAVKPGLHGGFWFLLKVSAYIYVFMWLRFTFPRYRFDQLMKLGWQFLLPVAMANLVGIAVALALHRGLGWNVVLSFGVTTVLTVAVAGFLVWIGEKKEVTKIGEEETAGNA